LAEISTLQTIKRWFKSEEQHSIVDADDFARLYDQNYLIVFRYIYGLLNGAQQDVEDITAETFMRAWATRYRFTGNDQAVIGWLLRIARNLVIDASRRKKVHAVDDNIEIESLLDTNATPEVDLMSREQTAILWNMLVSLTDETREMLVLRYMIGWQVKQIAAYLEMPENNVSVSIRRTLNRLQHNWKQS